MPVIHLLGRVALISNGHILLAHEIGAENTFLPGGHVEHNEAVKNAILRELREANLLPPPLLTIIPSYYRDRKSSLWTSTMENEKE